MLPSPPGAWQETFVDMITGSKPLAGEWFADGPALTPVQQIGVYRRQYELRLYDAVVEEVPGLAHVLGEEAETVLRAYLRDFPSTSWTLNDCANGLEGWLAANGHPLARVEMARLDRAVQRGFTAADGRTPTPNELAALPALALQPHVRLLQVQNDVHRMRSAVLSGADPPPLQQGHWDLVLFRRERKMRHWEVAAGQWWLLRHIEETGDVGAALERVVRDGIVSEDELAARVQRWFQDFTERDLVQLR